MLTPLAGMTWKGKADVQVEMKSVGSSLNRDLNLSVTHSLQACWTATLSGVQERLGTLHDAALTTCGVVGKRVSPPGGCPRNSCDNRGRTAA